MSFYGGFAPYVTVAERRARAEEAIKELRKKGSNISPIIIEGRAMAKKWWGKSWNKNLESYSDYSNRISRGRSYARHGSVIDLKITKGKVKALVLGSGHEPYKVNITIKELGKESWESIVSECLGKIQSIEKLLQGQFPEELEELFVSKRQGLFPTPREIEFHCDCPDYAIMCKHVAAVLYGVGARLDNEPSIFFTLRGVNMDDIISEAVTKETKTMLERSKKKGRRVIEDDEIFNMFGIDTDE
ncbi:MAG: SWIM zinc finger family protein [Anaeromicrobium sp.]|jgi:uncharacterized Zn finger protein|uniref:SWIM zinc finger family protein n=1 Tax=Anaeromicrobium sp. TaxID=1929132 RepID=UPI0025DA39A1|nr:SWIM zinc finger family protein [Anaeromicrobium sp.]MCT4595425.1 SWIM zinc finger family protein [Anaeromicrobium sp.]